MLTQQRRIVVMGGSFNPPTIAHFLLMKAAMQATHAEKGIFVPVGEAYLKRKMRRSSVPLRMSETLRLDMLRAICAGDPALTISEIELRSPMLCTRQTMVLLQEAHPDARLFFLAGADKLPILASCAKDPDFLTRFGVAFFPRDGADPVEAIRQDERLAPYEDAFVFVQTPEGAAGISSTAVRRMIADREAEKARPYVHEAVFPLIRALSPEDFPREIERFQGDYEFLANAFPAAFVYDGMTCSCAESAFQAAVCAQRTDRALIAQSSAQKAKSLAVKRPRISDVDGRKLAIMEDILRAKFAQHPDLAERLRATGDAVLICGSSKDAFWGRNLYTDQGENHLGKLLMDIRSSLTQQEEV